MANKQMLIAAAEKFIQKVETGRARSVQTYKELKDAIKTEEDSWGPVEQGPCSADGSPDGSLGGERDATAGGVDVSICKICGKNKKLLNGWCHDCWEKYFAEELG